MKTTTRSLAIDAVGLWKAFPSSRKPAVKNLDLVVEQGESVAFLGPNGAGKSTTIKMLCGILTPDQGLSRILGDLSGSKEANLSLGLVFGARSQLYFHMTVLDTLRMQAETYYLTGLDQRRRIAFLAQVFDCESLLQKRVRDLSLGQRMRCEIVASLLHSPKVILLDEPTIGLDITAKYRLREILKEWQSVEKTTMLLTSHDLSDVEALCGRAVLIHHGEKAFDGPIEGVKGNLRFIRRVKLVLAEALAQGHPQFPGVLELESEEAAERHFEFSLRDMPLTRVMQFLTEAYGENLLDVQISGVTLEEVIQKRFTHEGAAE